MNDKMAALLIRTIAASARLIVLHDAMSYDKDCTQASRAFEIWEAQTKAEGLMPEAIDAEIEKAMAKDADGIPDPDIESWPEFAQKVLDLGFTEADRLSEYHYRAKLHYYPHGERLLVIDFWPTRERWRNAKTKESGVGIESLAKHIKRVTG